MIEWAEVAPGTVLVASSDRAWLHNPSPFDPFAQPMTGSGSIETTRALLDAAISVFQHQRLQTEAPPLRVDQYVQRVLACYYGGTSTPPLLRRAAQGFRAAGRHDLEAWALETARAEDHDHLALADLAELGYPPDVVETLPLPQCMAGLLAYFETCVDGARPVSCMGYVYALERPSSLVQASYVEAIEKLLGPEINATRCLRWHSSLGPEPDHIDHLLEVVASLPASDRACVARAVYETSRILFADAAAATR